MDIFCLPVSTRDTIKGMLQLTVNNVMIITFKLTIISLGPNQDTKFLHSISISALKSRMTMCKMSLINSFQTFI